MEQDKKTVGRFPMDRFIKDVRNGWGKGAGL